MIDVTTCPICGSELVRNARAFFGAPFMLLKTDVTFNGSAFVRYSRCETCGLYVQSPRMTDEDIERYYGTGLYRAWMNLPVEAMDDDEYMRAAHDASLVVKLLGVPASHLDIGSSRGHFLQLVKSPVQVGVEPNTSYNINEQATVLPRMTDVTGEFELVSMIHSLEHVTDPMSVLRSALSLSSRWLLIEVPSEQSKGGWGRLAHTYHFPEETFSYIAESLSCKIKLLHHTPHTFVILEKEDVRA